MLLFYFLSIGPISSELEGLNNVIAQTHLMPDFQEVINTEMQELASIHSRHFPLVAHGQSIYWEVLPIHLTLNDVTYYWRTDTQVPSLVFPTSLVRGSLRYSPLLDSGGAMTTLPSAMVIAGEQSSSRENGRLIHGPYQIAADSKYVLILKRQEADVADALERA